MSEKDLKKERCHFDSRNDTGTFIVNNTCNPECRQYDTGADPATLHELMTTEERESELVDYATIKEITDVHGRVCIVSPDFFGPKVALNPSDEYVEKPYPLEKIKALAEVIVTLLQKEKPTWISENLTRDTIYEISQSASDFLEIEIEIDDIKTDEYKLGVERWPVYDGEIPEWQKKAMFRRQYFLVKLAREVKKILQQKFKDLAKVMFVHGLSMNFKGSWMLEISFDAAPGNCNKLFIDEEYIAGLDDPENEEEEMARFLNEEEI